VVDVWVLKGLELLRRKGLEFSFFASEAAGYPGGVARVVVDMRSNLLQLRSDLDTASSISYVGSVKLLAPELRIQPTDNCYPLPRRIEVGVPVRRVPKMPPELMNSWIRRKLPCIKVANGIDKNLGRVRENLACLQVLDREVPEGRAFVPFGFFNVPFEPNVLVDIEFSRGLLPVG
jgi:hypothetical protein